MIFTIHDCGFIARCAFEIDDAGKNRLNKIEEIIADCKYGIHDLSRTELDKTSKLPRFNMPLELGLFLGAKQFGNKNNQEKICLVFDNDQYRYQKFISDISGQDIKAHNDETKILVSKTRDWLSNCRKNVKIIIPGGLMIYKRYKSFKRDLPMICSKLKLTEKELTFKDFTVILVSWLKDNDIKA
jgi:hypothetical protein